MPAMTNGRINAEHHRNWASYAPLSAVDVVTTIPQQHLYVNSVTGCETLDLCLLEGKLLSFLTFTPQTQHWQKQFSDRAQHKHATPND